MADIDLKTLKHIAYMRPRMAEFSESCLKILDKLGNKVPLVFNNAQHIIHNAFEDQLARKNRVRKIVVKARQQGSSTYIGARFYHKASLNRGKKVFILTHEGDATDNLFAMVERYHLNNPLAPRTGASNAKELDFPGLDSSYAVGTAGAKESGRSGTSNLFHGSEVAFWPNAKSHFASSVQRVADMPGSEVALESTTCGVTGEFYERTQDAIAGIGDYEVVFIPWHVQEEYRRPDLVGPDFQLSEDKFVGSPSNGEALFSEVEYAELFGVDNAQMAWRRNKITELKSVSLFDQEYPASLALAFQQKAQGSYHKVGDIMRARKRTPGSGAGPLIIGVDPAGEGGDRFAIAFRRGYECEKVIWRDKVDTVAAVEWLKIIIDEHNPAVVFIDAGGIGAPIISTLRAKGPRYAAPHVRAVNFGAKSQAKQALPKAPGPINRRAEMQKRVAEWLALEEGVVIPDLDVLQADLLNVLIKPSLTNDLALMSKQEMRAKGIRSPDLADALGLTFADLTYIREYSGPKVSKNFAQAASQVIIPTQQEVFEYGDDAGSTGWMG